MSTEELREQAARAGFDLVARNFYSPVPAVPPESDPTWVRRNELPGLGLDLDAQLWFGDSVLAGYIKEFSLARDPILESFNLLNPWYGPIDAELLYATIRWLGPRRVLEIGGGQSSLVIGAAASRNALEGRPVDINVIDPSPRSQLADTIAQFARLEQRDAAELSVDRFTELESGDVLFVDSSHVVKRGGEVNHVVLNALPRLQDGVVVHFHDVFLPYEYPRRFFEWGSYFTEQYLLQAYLAENPRWQILFAAHALWHERHEQLSRLFPSARLRTTGPAAFWMRRA